MEPKFVVSSSPHLQTPETIDSIMRDVLIALVPPIIASVWLFGIPALWLVVVGTVSAMLVEALFVYKSISPRKLLGDGSAAVTGVLLALSVPPSAPWWMVVVGSFVAITIGKQLFGGIGYNIFNPALVGRAFIVLSWPLMMTHWTEPFTSPDLDAVSAATPLGGGAYGYYDLLIGTVPGTLGETSFIAIMLGGLFLLIRGHIDIRVPVGYLGAILLLALLSGEDMMFHLLSGSGAFAAIYMATCMVTSPFTKKGKLLFGVGCGLLTGLFRVFGTNPEGVTYAILLMNACVPLINKYTKPQIYGEVSS